MSLITNALLLWLAFATGVAYEDGRGHQEGERGPVVAFERHVIQDGYRFSHFRITNPSAEPWSYRGYGKDSPVHWVQRLDAGVWIDVRWTWCGTSRSSFVLETGGSFIMSVASGDDPRPLRIGVPGAQSVGQGRKVWSDVAYPPNPRDLELVPAAIAQRSPTNECLVLPFEDALRAINHMSQGDVAVITFELWRKVPGRPHLPWAGDLGPVAVKAKPSESRTDFVSRAALSMRGSVVAARMSLQRRQMNVKQIYVCLCTDAT